MKSLKTRGALIVEYALLLAVCCILGVVFLDAAPQVRDGVDNILQSTDKVLVDANDKIKGDKPGEEGDKTDSGESTPTVPGQNETNPSDSSTFHSTVHYMDKDLTLSDIGNHIKDDVWSAMADVNVGQKHQISSITWTENGDFTIGFDHTDTTITKRLNMNSALAPDTISNYGVTPWESGALYFSNGQVAKSSSDGTKNSYVVIGKTDYVGTKP